MLEEDENHYTDEPWTVDTVTQPSPQAGKTEEVYYVNHVWRESDAKPDESDHTDEIAQIVMEYPGRMSRNNACRIVACVNNCKGMNPYSIPYLLGILRRVKAASAQDGQVPSWITLMCEEVESQVKAPWVPGKELS